MATHRHPIRPRPARKKSERRKLPKVKNVTHECNQELAIHELLIGDDRSIFLLIQSQCKVQNQGRASPKAPQMKPTEGKSDVGHVDVVFFYGEMFS